MNPMNKKLTKDAQARAREELWAVIGRMSEAFKDVPPDEVEREVSIAVGEVRAEMRAEREQAAKSQQIE